MAILLVGGSKGGVGKTLLAFAIADYLEMNNHRFAIAECDSANSDFSSSFMSAGTAPPVAHISLDSEAGFRELIAFTVAQKSHVVVNSPAGFISFIRAYGCAFEGALRANNLALITYWPINRERDSLNALRQFIDHVTFPCIPVRNLIFGDVHEFDLFNNSRMKNELESKHYQTINLPVLASRCAVQMRNERWTIANAIESAPFSNRIELFRWRNLIHHELSGRLKNDLN